MKIYQFTHKNTQEYPKKLKKEPKVIRLPNNVVALAVYRRKMGKNDV